MKDLEKYKIKDQKLEELSKKELIPDATDGITVMRYLSALNDVLSSVRQEELSDDTFKHINLLQYYLTKRMEELVNIEYEVTVP